MNIDPLSRALVPSPTSGTWPGVVPPETPKSQAGMSAPGLAFRTYLEEH
jgi:hypothetical protein